MSVTHPSSGVRRIALVTGANRGIGREVARQLLDHGFGTILTAREEDKGRAAARELGAEFLQLDVSQEASVERCDDDGPTGGSFRDGRSIPW
jgi:NAD(P)-dependent dehydrogenase (short-subunit alcohol dehydrogenase family)